jgi:hypothetical protein
MADFIFPCLIFAALVLISVRGKREGFTRLTWPTAICFALFSSVSFLALNLVANRIGDQVFLWLYYGPSETSRAHLRIVWAPRGGEVLVSNGQRLASGFERALELLTMGIWMALLMATFFLVRFCLKKIAPALYCEIAGFFRQTRPPRS